MKTIVLKTRWFDHTLRLRIQNEVAEKIAIDPMEKINNDLDRAAAGCRPVYLSEGQCRKVMTYFVADDINYFDTAEII